MPIVRIHRETDGSTAQRFEFSSTTAALEKVKTLWAYITKPAFYLTLDGVKVNGEGREVL